MLVFVSGCTKREDYYELGIDDYSIVVGYDTSSNLSSIFDYDIKDTLIENEVIDNVDMYLINNFVGVGEFSNPKSKQIDSSDTILTSLTIYLNDLPERKFRINGMVLDSSIKANCTRYNGTYIEKNGYACVIESNVNDKLNVIEMHGDYLNLDQDILDHLTIYVK